MDFLKRILLVLALSACTESALAQPKDPGGLPPGLFFGKLTAW